MSSDVKYLKAPKGIILSTNTDASEGFIQLVAAELEGRLPSIEEIKQMLAENNVVFGIDEDAIADIINQTLVDTTIRIACGQPSHPGSDAVLDYLFDMDLNRKPKEDEHGRIDYKNLNYIQNAKAGQILVRKRPPTPGQPGKSVFGTEIPAKPGRDRQLGQGANTEVSHDGLALVAKIDGTLAVKFGVVSVQPNQSIHDSVDASTGNLDAAGSLKIGKNITCDFKVAVAHDLEVGGNVEDAVVQAGGNILIRGGFFGGGKGRLVAGGDVTAKYVENQKIRAGGCCYIGGECHNADVYADDSVTVVGRPGNIVGGSVAAKHLVKAGVIGNSAGVPTHIRVAYDMKTVERLREVAHEIERISADEKRIKEAMVVLYKLELNGKLPPDKKQALDQFKAYMRDLPVLLDDLKREQDELKSQLQELTGARIVAEERVYPGVVIHFGPVYKEIQEEVVGPVVFEKLGDAITKSTLDPNRERLLEEEWKKTKQQQKPTAAESPVPVNA